jgi:hypothetical protein
MRVRLTARVVLGLSLLGGCAHVSHLDPGRPDVPPSLEAMPDPGAPEAALPPRMREAWARARLAFAVPAPDMPVDPDVERLGRFIEGTLADWLDRKGRRVDAALAELDLAAEESHRQRVIAGALAGLLHEDIARVLLSLPVPHELDDDPEIARVYAETNEVRARRYVEHARLAYRACARNAAFPSPMVHFRRFCDGREDRLPLAEWATTVTDVYVTTVSIEH